jgi:hypothetical protein
LQTKAFNTIPERWKLHPDGIMERPQYMNKPADFNPDYSFHTCREARKSRPAPTESTVLNERVKGRHSPLKWP